MTSLRYAGGLLALLVWLSGCDSTISNPGATSKPVKPHAMLNVPKIVPFQPEVFDGALKDPFMPPAKLTNQPHQEVAKSTHVPEPLETFPLESLKLTGVMVDKTRKLGVIKTPDGAAFPVRVGSYVGQNQGRVVEITNRAPVQIVVREWVKSPVTQQVTKNDILLIQSAE